MIISGRRSPRPSPHHQRSNQRDETARIKQLLEVRADFYVVSEWVPLITQSPANRSRNAGATSISPKSSFISSVRADAATVNPRDVLIDESKQADIENLGDCLRVLGDGQSLGDFSLTIILYADDKRALDRLLPDVVRIMSAVRMSTEPSFSVFPPRYFRRASASMLFRFARKTSSLSLSSAWK